MGGARFAQLGFTPSYGPGEHGNLSCRTPSGLLVTARHTSKAALTPDDFVDVLEPEAAPAGEPTRLRYRGVRVPSTDSWMHWRIYQARPDVQAILHGHDTATLADAHALRVPITVASGRTASRELVEEVARLAQSHDYLQMREHGFIALGRTIDVAGELVRWMAARARGGSPRPTS